MGKIELTTSTSLRQIKKGNKSPRIISLPEIVLLKRFLESPTAQIIADCCVTPWHELDNIEQHLQEQLHSCSGNIGYFKTYRLVKTVLFILHIHSNINNYLFHKVFLQTLSCCSCTCNQRVRQCIDLRFGMGYCYTHRLLWPNQTHFILNI